MNRPIALRAAADALANVGVTEEGENRGKWVETYLRAVGLPPGSPWCAAFVRFRFEQAAAALKLPLPTGFPDSGWTPDYKDWARSAGLWVPVESAEAEPFQIRPGDLVCFYFSAKSRIAHIEIAVEPGQAWGVNTVGGNTGPEAGAEVQRDGDGVYRKRREWDELGRYGGFVRMNC